MNDMNDKQIVGRKKKLSIGLLFLVSVSVLGLVSILIINLFVTSSVKDKIITVDEAALLDSDCILILGAGVWDGGRPSYMLEDRLLQGIELYENGAADRLLMSGDHGRKEYDEVNVMKQFAIDRDINSEHIFMAHVSIRIPKNDLVAIKKAANKIGVGYTTYIRMLLKKSISR
jgi:SanA protein